MREYFPAALEAFADLDAPDALELLRSAPDPDRAARLSQSKIAAALRRANRRSVEDEAAQIQTALRAPALRQPAAVQAAFAVITASQVRLIAALNSEIAQLGEVVADHFGRHRDAEIYASQPGLGVILGARVLGEFGDDPRPLRRCESPQELRRHLTDHPRLGHQESGAGPLRPQPAARRRGPAMGLRLAERLTRRARLLRRAPSPQDRPPSRATPARQPPRRHPARLPEDRHPLRRNHRLGPPLTRRRLTSKNLGCLRGGGWGGDPRYESLRGWHCVDTRWT